MAVVRTKSAPTRGLALLAFLAIVAIVAVLGSSTTDTGAGSWYDSLDKPWWQPPSWLFAPAWSVLYVMIAVAGWLWWREGIDARPVLWWWALQLVLNLGWTLLFFGLESPALALADISLLALSLLACIVVGWQIRRAASLLFIPYLAWVAFATSLNLGIVLANR